MIQFNTNDYSAVLPDGNGGFVPCPELMTQDELVRYLRLPDVSKAKNYSHSIKHLADVHGLPSIHISRQPLYPLSAVRKWIEEKLEKEQKR